MQEEFIGKVISDEDGRDYHVISILGEGGQGVILKTQEGFLLKINTSIDKDKYQERYRWLMRKGAQLPKETRIAFPISILAAPYVGYVMQEVAQAEALESYMEQPEEISSFVDWYFNATGGLTRRLLIGYWLAKGLRYLHINGCAYVDLSPQNVLIVKGKNSLALIDSDNITSGTYLPLIKGTDFYMAPEITKGTGTVNSLSDTYSYAVLLFKLLTACHPYVGDEAEDMNPEYVCRKINNGEFDFIGDPNSVENKSSIYSNTEVFLTEELKSLFVRMFVEGKNSPEKRPTLMEFIKALKHARYSVIQCTEDNCDAEYYYSGKQCKCPACDVNPAKVYAISSMQMVKGDKKILLPIKKSKELDPVLAGGREQENILFLTKNNKTITSSFFDECVPFEEEKNMLVFGRSTNGKLAVANYCSDTLMVTDSQLKNKQEMKSYIKGKTSPTIIDGDSMIFLSKNMDLCLEVEAIDLSQLEKFYGKAQILRFLKITEA